jgi:hypothetical protein
VIVRLIDDRKLIDMAASERLTLAPTEIARLRAGDLTGFSVDHMISVLNAFDQRVDVEISPDATVGAATTPEAEGHRPARNPLLSIVQYMQELNAKIPVQELERRLTDLAANHDHYLYGAPKRE